MPVIGQFSPFSSRNLSKLKIRKILDGQILGEDSKDSDKTLKSTQNSVSSSANNKPQKNSVMDTAKKICRKLSGSIPKRESKQQLFYLSESDESDDDVFC